MGGQPDKKTKAKEAREKSVTEEVRNRDAGAARAAARAAPEASLQQGENKKKRGCSYCKQPGHKRIMTRNGITEVTCPVQLQDERARAVRRSN